MDNIYYCKSLYNQKGQHRIKDILIPKKKYEKRSNQLQINRNNIENRRFGKEIKDINNLTEINNNSNSNISQIGEILYKIKKENRTINYKDNSTLNIKIPSFNKIMDITNIDKVRVLRNNHTLKNITDSNYYPIVPKYSSITTRHNHVSCISIKKDNNTLMPTSSNSRLNQGKIYKNSVVIKNLRKMSTINIDNSRSTLDTRNNYYKCNIDKINEKNSCKSKGKENDINKINVINNNYYNYNNRSKYKKRTIDTSNSTLFSNNSIKNLNRERHINKFIRKQYNLIENASKKLLNISLQYRDVSKSKDNQNNISYKNSSLNIGKRKDNFGLIPINKHILERYNNNYYLKYPINTNPQIPKEYIDDIYDYYKSIEYEDLPTKNYMNIIQNDINENMRFILLDWLVQVHMRFNLLTETLFITINLIDRFLSKKTINRRYLQLLGITALLIACKYEEIYPPQIKDLINMTDNAYNRKQVYKMEYEILNAVKFNLSFPTTLKFLQIFKNKLNLTEKTFNRCLYFIEASLIDYKSSRFNPSLIASTSLFFNLMNKAKIDIVEYDEKSIVNITGYNKNSIMECFYCLNNSIKNLENIWNKYNHLRRNFKLDKFHNVSEIKYYIDLKEDIESQII